MAGGQFEHATMHARGKSPAVNENRSAQSFGTVERPVRLHAGPCCFLRSNTRRAPCRAGGSSLNGTSATFQQEAPGSGAAAPLPVPVSPTSPTVTGSPKSDSRNHRAIVQPRLYDSSMVTRITLNTESPHGLRACGDLLIRPGPGPGLIILAAYDAATLIT